MSGNYVYIPNLTKTNKITITESLLENYVSLGHCIKTVLVSVIQVKICRDFNTVNQLLFEATLFR